MKKITIQIKHMVCPRCISSVTNELAALGLKVESVELGTATYVEDMNISLASVEEKLKQQGFELIRNSDEELVEQVKTALIGLIHYKKQNNEEAISYPDYLADKVGKSYNYLSKVFSQHCKKTIERYIILLKVEKAKELIEYNQKTFAEIAYALGYKSPTHLAQQFKEVTGVTMGDYKKRFKEIGRKTLNEL
jgi:AraC family transcriptional regulator